MVLMINKKYCKIWENFDANVKEQYFGKSGTCFQVCRALRDELIDIFTNHQLTNHAPYFTFLLARIGNMHSHTQLLVGGMRSLCSCTHLPVCEMHSCTLLLEVCVSVHICW